MKKVHSHYENLQVARNASPEVIRGAYKYLSQKYHPDLNQGNTEAARIMSMLNAAYDTLSDPTMRKQHDAWIAAVEARADGFQQSRNMHGTAKNTTFSRTDLWRALNKPRKVAPKTLWAIAFLIFFVWLANLPKSPPAYIRPAVTPSGYPWPTVASYVFGYPLLNNGGLSEVAIDNIQNESDVFVKLMSLSGGKAFPARTFFIPAHGYFLVQDVTVGTYDVRYRDLNTGALSRSDAFTLQEIKIPHGVEYSQYTLKLYKVKNRTKANNGPAENEF